MNAYFDLPNILSYIHSISPRNDDCERMLKENFNVLLTFSKEDVLALDEREQDDFKLWLTGWMEGSKSRPSYDCCIPTKPYQFITLSSDKKISSPFLSAYCCPVDLQTSETLLYASCGEEKAKLSSLFLDSFQFTEDIFFDINKWEDLNNFTSPCTDIIIVDQYILSSPELYDSNLYKLISILASKSGDNKINIVIFTLKDNYDKRTNIKFIPDWDEIYTKIRKCCGGKSRPNVTFVTASKYMLQEHDRTIFTNYKLFSSGDTFNYFDSKGERITNGRYFHYHSAARKKNLAKMIKFISDMQKVINHVHSRDKDLIIKNKKSNFLTFPEVVQIGCTE